ncbi:MAG: putative lipid II flippase MurJ [Chlamydiae bacterium]|nr:putative lipid II flippase MurJ [Chlamydiota bacterium]
MRIQDTSQTITRSFSRFFSGTLISRVTGMAREVAMAAVFGTHPSVAAFWMAYRFAYLFRRILGEGALHVAFVPHFESLRKEDPKKGARFFYDLLIGLSSLLLLLTLTIEGALGGVLLFGHPSAATQEVLRLTMLLLPALIFLSLYALNTSLLNCEGSFFLPSVAPAILNIAWLTALFFLWKSPPQIAMERLAQILVFAFLFQWAFTLPKVFSFLSKELQREKQKRFAAKEMISLLRPFLLIILGVVATQLNTALDSLFARAASSEGPAYLWYAMRIHQLPLALFGVGMAGALLPPITRALQNRDQARFREFLQLAVRKSITLMLPMTIGMFALGYSGLSLLYAHGAFTDHALVQTAHCLWAYGVALLPMSGILILAAAFFAQKKYLLPTLLTLSTLLCNTTLNALFVYLLSLGPISIALATSFSATLHFFALAYFLQKTHKFSLFPPLTFSLKILVASLLALLLTLTLSHFAFPILIPRTLPLQLLRFTSETATYFLALFGVAALFKLPDLSPRRLLSAK